MFKNYLADYEKDNTVIAPYLEIMRSAKSVEEWNEKRASSIADFEYKIGDDGYDEDSYNILVTKIDASGLIIEVLGHDSREETFYEHRRNN